ncbi:MAG: amidinotransferase, partial [Deltaproteobacteria bacterium]|nr:amidinotransferase [Deltaproteobacteria bacterium]
MKYGCQSEIGPIKSILLKHPKDAFYDQEYVNANWKDLNYIGYPDYETVVKEFDAFAAVLKKEASDIHFLPENSKTGMDSIYTHDPALITENGAILCNMGKKQRQKEPSAMGQYLTELDIPILGSISGAGRLEGGDVVWLDERTLAVGLTYRSNAEGIRQLKELTADIVEDIIPVPLPHWNGENDCFHLMSIISPVDNDLAVVYSRLMPVFFREML